MRRLLKKNYDRLMVMMLLIGLSSVAFYIFAGTPLTLQPTGVVEITEAERDSATVILVTETGKEIFPMRFYQVAGQVVRFAERGPRCCDHQMLSTCADYFLLNALGFNHSPPTCRRSGRDPAYETEA